MTTTSPTATGCAVYARKSTEQNGVADAERSVARQVEHARAYAVRKGWTVSEDHVYIDDGISGAIFGEKRPGLARLLNALRPRRPFDVLVMSEESRLGREQIETAYTLKQITDAGVRVFFYLEDKERTLDTALDKVLLSLTSFASEMEREKAGQRTHDTLIRKARAGHVASGATFGYRNVRREPGGPVTREIVPLEAAIIRRIFEMVASGMGFRAIAIALNDEHAPSPAPRRPHRPGGWAPSTVRSIVMRDTYRGVSIWNRNQRVLRNGTRKQFRRPRRDWVTVETPQTRIVSDEVWRRAHDRLAASREVYLKATNGEPFGRPINGTPSRYLLTGFGVCGGCGSSMFIGRTLCRLSPSRADHLRQSLHRPPRRRDGRRARGRRERPAQHPALGDQPVQGARTLPRRTGRPRGPAARPPRRGRSPGG
jgi:DNA invertase Pin-like site-specific DNA recombinase